MARYPAATFRPVARYQPGASLFRPQFVARRLIFHTAVSDETPSMHAFFNTSGNATPHFYVGRGGEVEQYIDTAHGSGANLDGNHDCVTVETFDGFPTSWNGQGVGPPWTAGQVEALARLAVWCHRAHDIPLVRLPSSRPGTRGIGWHRLGIDGNFPEPPGGLLGGRVDGGERWSTKFGKACPTATRIRQIVEQVLPRAGEIARGDDEVTPQDIEKIAEATAAAVWAKEVPVFDGKEGEQRGARMVLAQIHNRAGRIPDTIARDLARELKVTEKAVVEALKKVLTPTP